MKMVKELEEAFSRQMTEEMNSWYVYLDIAAWYVSRGLDGFANWMHEQAKEELFHAEKLRNYVFLRGNQIFYSPVGVSIEKFSGQDPVDGLKAGLKHEKMITDRVAKLSSLCAKFEDQGAQLFLQWFVSEQEEEEDSVQSLIEKMEIAGNSRSALLAIDEKLSRRVFEK